MSGFISRLPDLLFALMMFGTIGTLSRDDIARLWRSMRRHVSIKREERHHG